MNEKPVICGESAEIARLVALALKRFHYDEARGFRKTFATPYSQYRSDYYQTRSCAKVEQNQNLGG